MCRYLKSYQRAFTPARRRWLYLFLGGKINCPVCKEVHELKYEEETKNEHSKC